MNERFNERLKALLEKEETNRENTPKPPLQLNDITVNHTFKKLRNSLKERIEEINRISENFKIRAVTDEYRQFKIEKTDTNDSIQLFVERPNNSFLMRVEFNERQLESGIIMASFTTNESYIFAINDGQISFQLAQITEHDILYDADTMAEYLLNWFLDLMEKRLNK